MDYLSRFKRAGNNVRVHPDVFIEHPEIIEVGDDVTFAKGVYICGQPKEFRAGSRVLIETNVYMILDDARLIIGDDVRLYPFVYISGGKNSVEIGNHTHFAPGCVIYGQGGTRVGNHCAFAAHTMLAGVAHDWHRSDGPMDTTEISAPILIEDNVYTGANVVINMGVTIRHGCCLAANSVVLEDTEPNGFYAGAPARRKCSRGGLRMTLLPNSKADILSAQRASSLRPSATGKVPAPWLDAPGVQHFGETEMSTG